METQLPIIMLSDICPSIALQGYGIFLKTLVQAVAGIFLFLDFICCNIFFSG